MRTPSVRHLPILLAAIVALVTLSAEVGFAAPSAAAPRAAEAACATSSPTGNCGPYHASYMWLSDGYNTYVANNCWADPSCKQTVTATSPAHWSVTSTELYGNSCPAVRTYPTVYQLTDNTHSVNFPISKLRALFSHYNETSPPRRGSFEAAYDLWLSNFGGGSQEIMIWVDTRHRSVGSYGTLRAAVNFNGAVYRIYTGAKGTNHAIFFVRQQNATSSRVAILAMMIWLQSHGYLARTAGFGQIDFGFEICSTGRGPETFTVNNYTLKGFKKR
jgi:hypothetical protein